jgi:hypothetical protein
VASDFLLSTPWPGLLLWCTLYASDYWFTLTCARLYRCGVSDHIVFEGSYEITPFYQRDIDALRAWSPRFLTVLTLSVLFLWIVWSSSTSEFDSGFYLIVLGSLLLTELVVHIRHLRNWFLFRTMVRLGGIRGRIEYPRRVMLMASSLEILSFAGLFAVIFVVTGSPFVLGGALSCAVLATQHLRLARKHVAALDQTSDLSSVA